MVGRPREGALRPERAGISTRARIKNQETHSETEYSTSREYKKK